MDKIISDCRKIMKKYLTRNVTGKGVVMNTDRCHQFSAHRLLRNAWIYCCCGKKITEVISNQHFLL